MRVVWVLAVIAIGVVLTPLGGAANTGGESASAFGLRVFARGFEDPVLITQAPGEPNVHYVVEQPGRVIRLRGSRRTVFLDVRDDVVAGGEQGLLGLAFHPRYERNRLFYIAYTSNDGRNVVERFRSNGSTAVRSTRARLLSIVDPYGNHNGGHVVFGPDGLLYTSIGDAGSGGDPEDRAQDMRTRFGKLLTLDVSKRRPSWKIAALGLRNPWRFSWDRGTGDLYIADVGQNTVEEVNVTRRGSAGLENYGWDIFEGSRRHEDTPRGPGKLVFPVHEYANDGNECSVTGGFVYRGKARASERGRYVFGDYCSGQVWSFRMSGGNARDLRSEFRVSNVSSFGEGLAGELFAVSHGGTIYRLG